MAAGVAASVVTGIAVDGLRDLVRALAEPVITDLGNGLLDKADLSALTAVARAVEDNPECAACPSEEKRRIADRVLRAVGERVQLGIMSVYNSDMWDNIVEVSNNPLNKDHAIVRSVLDALDKRLPTALVDAHNALRPVGKLRRLWRAMVSCFTAPARARQARIDEQAATAAARVAATA